MKIFLDTDVLLDVLAKREPHYAAAARIWSLCEEGKFTGCISVISFNNIYYIARKLKGKKSADAMMRLLRDLFLPVELDGQLLNLAIGAGFKDFEDAIQFHSAIRSAAEFLLTRNTGHFPARELPVLTPMEFLASQRIDL